MVWVRISIKLGRHHPDGRVGVIQKCKELLVFDGAELVSSDLSDVCGVCGVGQESVEIRNLMVMDGAGVGRG